MVHIVSRAGIRPRIRGAATNDWPQFISYVDAFQAGDIELAEDAAPFFALFDRLIRDGCPFADYFIRAVDDLRRSVLRADPDGESDQDEAGERREWFVTSDDAPLEQRERILVERSWSCVS